ncbi:aryl-sulfate sulfotransferase [Cognatishimia sp.]|uniref:aryl-sulfate sulfotransferase n=1 Tax=Cognatishimia sp. TaxID=2211648 RepID=UPI003514D478|nr:aryl-sulfate sulfotransferase [Cognatishimia sp.]
MSNTTDTPVFLSAPTLVPCNEDVPLAVRLDVQSVGAERVLVRISQAGEIWTTDHATGTDPLLVLGFMPDHDAEITVQLKGAGGTTTHPDTLVFSPEGVPTSHYERPPIKLAHADPERMAGNFTFLSVRRRATGRIPDMSPAQRQFTTKWGMLLAIDHQGRVRWMRKMKYRTAGLERLASGNLFVHDTEFCSSEIGMDGELINAWYAQKRPQGPHDNATPVDVQSLHHQPHQMPNGNFLAVSGHARLAKDWPASVHEPEEYRADKMIVGDKAIEFTPEGKVVWEWDSFDHLDVNRIGYDALDAYWHVRGFPNHGDWTHCNGVAYDEENDQVLLSLRLQDCIIAIDKKSGEINWILGAHSGWNEALSKKLLTPVGDDFRWPWHGHNPRVTGSNQFIMFDNGIYQARPGEERVPFHKSFSRGVEFKVNAEEMTVEQVWSSARTDEDVKERSWAMSDAHRFFETDTAMIIHSIAMPHGRDDIGIDEEDRTVRYVADYPSYARILEYNRADIKDVIFDCYIRDEHEIIQWEAFSGVRVQSLYPASADVIWTDGDALEDS